MEVLTVAPISDVFLRPRDIDVVTDEIEAVLAQLPEHPARVVAEPPSTEQ